MPPTYFERANEHPLSLCGDVRPLVPQPSRRGAGVGEKINE